MTEEALIAESQDRPEEPFDAPVRTDPTAADDAIDALIVNLDGYEGPLDVLLDLARTQRVDIRKISMLALVEQYLAFVEAARLRDLELAADYLVMAAWLAFLKSKLLLPAIEGDGEEPTADEMAARLAFQLQRLEAMRKAAEALMNAPQLGINVFPRGAPEGVRVRRKSDWQASLFELLQAYTRQRIASVDRTYTIDPPKVFSIEEARARLERILGAIPEWTELRTLVPPRELDAPAASVTASAFNAALEFAKNGLLDIRQLRHFEPIYVRRRENGAAAERTDP
ncbi:MAG: ScpA family protein [Pseudomonadota bacterium]|nr:ScpA family protein [Pseudomonadota bacterium]